MIDWSVWCIFVRLWALAHNKNIHAHKSIFNAGMYKRLTGEYGYTAKSPVKARFRKLLLINLC